MTTCRASSVAPSSKRSSTGRARRISNVWSSVWIAIAASIADSRSVSPLAWVEMVSDFLIRNPSRKLWWFLFHRLHKKITQRENIIRKWLVNDLYVTHRSRLSTICAKSNCIIVHRAQSSFSSLLLSMRQFDDPSSSEKEANVGHRSRNIERKKYASKYIWSV